MDSMCQLHSSRATACAASGAVGARWSQGFVQGCLVCSAASRGAVAMSPDGGWVNGRLVPVLSWA
jgi:hypothetical protein